MMRNPDFSRRLIRLLADLAFRAPVLGVPSFRLQARLSSRLRRRRLHPRASGWSRYGPGLSRSGEGSRRQGLHSSLGSTLLQALVAGLIAVIASLLLTSRLLASRFNTLNRSDVQVAREAAEFGLNEIQEELNKDQRAYLWVTKFTNWSTVTLNSLNACRVAALDVNGNSLTALPSLPEGVIKPKPIKSDSDVTISYQVSAFTPPTLPDSDSTTSAQAGYCGTNSTDAANFGNLNGGSALITVTGSVTRGSRTTNFKLRRNSHVVSPAGQLKFSFMILGNARSSYSSGTTTVPALGESSDIARLNRADGDICYGTIGDANCNNKPKTVIGCFDLESCLVNNVVSLTPSQLLNNCSVQTGKKKSKGYTCNSFQQAGPLPPIPTPASELTAVSTATEWATFAYEIECSLKRDGANKQDRCKSTRPEDKATKLSKIEVKDQYNAFPYIVNNVSALNLTRSSLTGMKNSDLVRGCYFSNTSPSDMNGAFTSQTLAVNCLVADFDVKERESSNTHLTVHTVGTDGSELPRVNLFVHGTQEIKLDDGGIENNDADINGWSRLRILGKSITPNPTTGAISCAGSSRIKIQGGGKGQNDLSNLFLWLPNGHLHYDKEASNDNTYLVAWVCEFTGPTKDKKGAAYSIITPLPEQAIRDGLFRTFGSSFFNSVIATYRGFGSEDTPAP